MQKRGLFAEVKEKRLHQIKNGLLTSIKTLLLILLIAFFVVACGGSEERKAEFLKRGIEKLEKDNLEKAKVDFRNVLQIDPKNAQATYHMGVIEERKGDHRRAFAFFNKAVELDPDYVDAQVKLAKYFATFDIIRAAELNDKVLAVEPQNPGAQINRALILAKSEKVDGAISLLDDILLKDPDNTDAALLQYHLYGQQGNGDSQRAVLEKAIAAAPEDIQLRKALANHHVRFEDFDKAEKQLQELIRIVPEDVKNWEALARVYLQTNRLDRAEQTLRDSVKADPDDETRFLQLAYFLFKQVDKARGILELKILVERHPDFRNLPFLLAGFYTENDQAEEAKRIYSGLIEKHKIESLGIKARIQLAKLLLLEDNKPEAVKRLDEILAENPHDNEALLMMSQIAIRENNTEQAIANYRILLRDQPENANLHALMVQALTLENRLDLALEHLESAVTSQPDNVRLRLQLARILAQLSDFERSMEQVDEALKRAPNDLAALQAKSSILAMKGEKVGAESLLKQLSTEHPENVSADFKLGQLYLSQKKYKTAVASFEQALHKQPNSPTILAGLMDAYIAQGYPAKAEEKINHFIRNHPENFVGRTVLARFYVTQEKHDEAIVELKRALDLQPRYFLAMSFLVNAMQKTKNLEGAIVYLNGVREKDSKHPFVNIFLGNVYVALGKFDKAEFSFHQAIDVNPTFRPAYEELAKFYLSRGNEIGAGKTFRKGLEKLPNDVVLKMKLAGFYEMTRNFDNAINLYQEIVEKAPTNYLAKNNLAVLLTDYKSDQESLDKALKLVNSIGSSDNAVYQDTLGWIYLKLGDIDKALPILENAAKNGKQYGEIQYHLGVAFYKNGDSKAAKLYLGKALEIDAKSDWSQKAKDLIEKL